MTRSLNGKELIERDLGILSESENYLQYQFEKIEPFIGRRILEIGSGIGNHTKRLLSRRPELLIALEKELVFCQEIEKQLGTDVEVLNVDLGDISAYEDRLRNKKIETVIALNVLEHVENDFECLKKLSNIIMPGGRIILIVPAFTTIYSRLDKYYGHYRRYNRKMFKKYADELRMELKINSYFNMLGWFGWFIAAKIGKTGKINKKLMGLFDKLIPLLNAIEKVFPSMPFGLSLLGVLGKK